MEFTWDIAKSERNLRDRGFGFDFAARIFRGLTVEKIDARREYGEVRVQAIGAVGEVVLVVVYTDRDGVRRIISARPASKKERASWPPSE